MYFFPLLTALAMLGIGIGALRLNARRPINQALAMVCFLSVLIFAVQLIAKYEGELYISDGSGNPLLWIRLKYALIGLLSPLMVWVCYYLVSGRYTSRRSLLMKLTPWMALSAFLFCFPFTEAFKPNDSLPGNVRQGQFYYLYFLPMLAGQVCVCLSSMAVARRLSGVRKVEFTFITISLGYLSLAAVLVETIFATWPGIPGIQLLTRVLSYLVYLVFGIGAWSVTCQRVYHSGQVVLSILERSIVIGAISMLAIYGSHWVSEYDPSIFVAATIVGVAYLLLSYADDKIRGWLKLHADNKTTAAVAELHRASYAETDAERLTKRLESVLRSFAQCSGVSILTLEQGEYRCAAINLPARLLKDAGFFAEGWASTATFARTPPQAEKSQLHSALVQAQVSVLVCPRWRTRDPSLIVAFSERLSELPYTHPEIRLMRDLTDVSDSLYTQAILSLQAQQAEQLASIGRLGLTILHELRNPMSTLKSFSQLLPERIGDTAFLRDFAEVIPQEAERVETLAQQLLDLSKPRNYRLQHSDVHKLIEDIIVLWRPHADAGKIKLLTTLHAGPACMMIDPDAIRQVIINLLRNASEALTHRPANRKIEVRTRRVDSELFIEVEDNGPGLSPDIRGRIFDTFGTTSKSTGTGLGLSICREIVAQHGGTITADVEREHGCIFQIALPYSREV